MSITRDTVRHNEELSKAPRVMVDEEMISFRHTLAGTPEAVTFLEHGLPNMADSLYRVMFSGEFAGTPYVDESSITETGFSFVGGAATEVVHFFVHGKVYGRKRF